MIKEASQRWEHVADLFEQLATMPAAQRPAFLNEVCGTDADLHQELTSLLGAHEQTSGPLDAAPAFNADPADAAGAQDVPGTQVGPYRLLRLIGEGGMGNVWLAERADGVLKRSVALKRPHISWVGSLAERMAQERDILASLEHPNIARLYDAGVSTAGQPYLALEFVEGVPITHYCSAQQLGVRKQLTLFLQVLEAVQYAHAHLIIHRDIKPSNILVSSDARVHLLDFGIAKLLAQDLSEDASTGFAAALTPDYASPEQFRGEGISTASDVYSLGVVLYEMLTGTRPYHLRAVGGAARAEALTQIEIPVPSQRAADPAVKRITEGDLDAIIGKALRQDPKERYASAEALAADIRRYLDDEPVSAQPDRFGYRARKFIARNRWQSVSAAVAACALIVGAALALWQAHVARQEAARAEQVKAFVLSMLDSADSDSGAGATTTAVDLLQAARRRVDAELADRPAIAAELMSAIAYGLIGQGRAEDASTLLTKAIDISTRVNGPDDARTVGAQVIQGEALYMLGKNEEAIALLESAAARAHRIQNIHAEVDAHRWLSAALLDAGDYDKAIASARAAVGAVPTAGIQTNRGLMMDAMQAHAALANALEVARQPGLVDEARLAIKYADEIGGDAGHSLALLTRGALGVGLYREGQVQAGLLEIKRAYDDTRKLRGDNHEQTSSAANVLANACLEAGDLPCALDAFQADYDIINKRTAKLGPFVTGAVSYGFGLALTAAQQHEKALPLILEGARLFAEAQGAESALALRSRSVHAWVLARKGDLVQADQEFSALSALPFAGVEKAAHSQRLAILRSLQGRHDEAVSLARAAAVELDSLPSQSKRGKSALDLGTVLLAAGQSTAAVVPLEKAITLFKQSQIPDSPDFVAATTALRRAQTSPVR